MIGGSPEDVEERSFLSLRAVRTAATQFTAEEEPRKRPSLCAGARREEGHDQWGSDMDGRDWELT